MLYHFRAGRSPLLVNVPHAGTELPARIVRRFTAGARALPDTDWHVDRVVASAPGSGASLLSARYSRYVVDLNRGSDDRPLYSGATTGLVPIETFAGEPVYSGDEPDAQERSERVESYWQPYHDHLRETIEAIRRQYGFAVILDAHSIRSEVPRLFDGRLPDLNLGTYDERSCAAELQAIAAETLDAADGFTTVANGRFKGGFITRHYGRPDAGVHALQLEIAQSCYMDEADPRHFDPQRAAPLTAVIESLIERLTAWRP